VALAEVGPKYKLDDFAAFDLFHDEYRSDFKVALTTAERRVERAKDSPQRLQAHMYKARVLRLRGEYTEAAAILDGVLANVGDDHHLLRLRAMVERHWVDIDRLAMPWGALDSSHNDLTCMVPELERANIEFANQFRWQQNKLIAATKQDPILWSDSIILSSWIQLAENHARGLSLISDAGRHPDTSTLDRNMVDSALRSVSTDTLLAEKWKRVPHDRVEGIRLRLGGPCWPVPVIKLCSTALPSVAGSTRLHRANLCCTPNWH